MNIGVLVVSPPCFMQFLLNRGEILTVQSDNVVASAWMDNKIFTVMSVGWDPTKVVTVLRTTKDGTRKPFPCPAACADYNKFMGGVDRGDQLRGYYHNQVRSRKFYKYIANFMFGVAVTNAFILYRIKNPGKNTKLKKFREVLAVQLTKNYCTRRTAGRKSHIIQPLPYQHFPRKTPNETGRKRGRCVLCQESKIRADTPWKCMDCGVWLCHQGTEDDCFLKWHKKNI